MNILFSTKNRMNNYYRVGLVIRILLRISVKEINTGLKKKKTKLHNTHIHNMNIVLIYVYNIPSRRKQILLYNLYFYERKKS